MPLPLPWPWLVITHSWLRTQCYHRHRTLISARGANLIYGFMWRLRVRVVLVYYFVWGFHWSWEYKQVLLWRRPHSLVLHLAYFAHCNFNNKRWKCRRYKFSRQWRHGFSYWSSWFATKTKKGGILIGTCRFSLVIFMTIIYWQEWNTNKSRFSPMSWWFFFKSIYFSGGLNGFGLIWYYFKVLELNFTFS